MGRRCGFSASSSSSFSSSSSTKKACKAEEEEEKEEEDDRGEEEDDWGIATATAFKAFLAGPERLAPGAICTHSYPRTCRNC
jgi:hypothetical protein